jgi:hypothetical protein
MSRGIGFARMTVVGSMLGVLLAAGVGNAIGQKDSPAAGGQPSHDEMMKQMMELATPGEAHKELGRLVGTWRTTNKMWMGPGEPTVSNGTSTYKWVLGGRYLQSQHIGDFGGMPFEGMGIDGYDKGQKEYFTLWFDTMGTGFMSLKGRPSTDGKGLTFTGTVFDPSQMREVNVREESRWLNDNKYIFTMFMDMPGPDGKSQETKVLELTGERQ